MALLIIYITLSVALCLAYMQYVYQQHDQLYPAMIALSNNNVFQLMTGNGLLALFFLFYKMFILLLFGRLTDDETAMIRERLIMPLLDSLLLLATFSEELNLRSMLLLLFSISNRVLHWVAASRLNDLERVGEGIIAVPNPAPDDEANAVRDQALAQYTVRVRRLVFALLVLLCIDVIGAGSSYSSLMEQGISTAVIYFYHYIITLIAVVNISVMMGLDIITRLVDHINQVRQQQDRERQDQEDGNAQQVPQAPAARPILPPWLLLPTSLLQKETLRTIRFFTELTFRLAQAVFAVIFLLSMLFVQSLPFLLYRDLLLSIKEIWSIIQKFKRYYNLVQNIDRLLKNATEEQLNRDRTCSICYEYMASDLPPETNRNGDNNPHIHEKSSNKALPCGHVFHRHCLKAWLEQKETCPYCGSNLYNNVQQPRREPARAADADNPNRNPLRAPQQDPLPRVERQAAAPPPAEAPAPAADSQARNQETPPPRPPNKPGAGDAEKIFKIFFNRETNSLVLVQRDAEEGRRQTKAHSGSLDADASARPAQSHITDDTIAQTLKERESKRTLETLHDAALVSVINYYLEKEVSGTKQKIIDNSILLSFYNKLLEEGGLDADASGRNDSSAPVGDSSTPTVGSRGTGNDAALQNVTKMSDAARPEPAINPPGRSVPSTNMIGHGPVASADPSTATGRSKAGFFQSLSKVVSGAKERPGGGPSDGRLGRFNFYQGGKDHVKDGDSFTSTITRSVTKCENNDSHQAYYYHYYASIYPWLPQEYIHILVAEPEGRFVRYLRQCCDETRLFDIAMDSLHAVALAERRQLELEIKGHTGEKRCVTEGTAASIQVLGEQLRCASQTIAQRRQQLAQLLSSANDMVFRMTLSDTDATSALLASELSGSSSAFLALAILSMLDGSSKATSAGRQQDGVSSKTLTAAQTLQSLLLLLERETIENEGRCNLAAELARSVQLRMGLQGAPNEANALPLFGRQMPAAASGTGPSDDSQPQAPEARGVAMETLLNRSDPLAAPRTTTVSAAAAIGGNPGSAEANGAEVAEIDEAEIRRAYELYLQSYASTSSNSESCMAREGAKKDEEFSDPTPLASPAGSPPRLLSITVPTNDRAVKLRRAEVGVDDQTAAAGGKKDENKFERSES